MGELESVAAIQGSLSSEDVKETIIPCPKCRAPGILYSKRSIAALIASKHIAHLLHPSTGGRFRRACLRTRSEFQHLEHSRDKLRSSHLGFHTTAMFRLEPTSSNAAGVRSMMPPG